MFVAWAIPDLWGHSQYSRTLVEQFASSIVGLHLKIEEEAVGVLIHPNQVQSSLLGARISAVLVLTERSLACVVW